MKPRFNDALNTGTVLLLFIMTFSWYSLTSAGAPLISLTNNIKTVFVELTASVPPTTGTASTTMFAVPQVFGVATWINILLLGIAYFFLIIGVLTIILRPKGTEIFEQYRIMLIAAAVILAVAVIIPSIGAILNFPRFYAITLLILLPCFVLGGQTLLATIGKTWTKIKRTLKRQSASKSKNINRALLLIAIILGGYFLSQVGFVNYVTNGPIHSYTIDFEKIETSNEIQAKISILYDVYIPEQDAYSASWLLNHKAETAEVFADSLSEFHALVSYGLIPKELLLPITNTTIPPQGSFVYLGTLNIVNGVITTPTGSFNTSEISFLLDQNNLVYSNGNSEVWSVTPAP